MPSKPLAFYREPTTLEEWQARYELTMRTRASWTAASRYVDPLVSFLGKKRRPQDVFRADARAYYEHIQTLKDISKLSLRNYARAFFQFIFDHEAIDTNPFILPKKPAEIYLGKRT